MGRSVEKTKFCKLSQKMTRDEPEAFVKLVSKPKYTCRKCFRVSARKENLCSPQKLKKLIAQEKKDN
ncbi:hypothetical protein CSB45_00105 [candidate division KSB3 bacterium]|uniref:Uncharacterized protein n=1 Tax=candidate division KSB3 bacterium TaxID=2044937 RepID=A0A2G6EGT7_9BACT|nr:MAG: hypothetical protein CSB45_00105 [candidate division KSB3 bacterium]PIE31121.1 MAG: hypothetical protein CSA57_00190 [candidate division KSB3 bacterium]